MKTSSRVIRIGTRGSRLARIQSTQVLQALQKVAPRYTFKLIVIRTEGDIYQAVELFKKNKIGVFTNEIEKKLLSGKVDIAVHSLKDLPTCLASGLVLAAVPKRLDARDVLISRQRHTIASLPLGASVATGSPRRKRQLLLLRPDLKLHDLAGNLDTRVNRVLRKKDFDAIVLAGAGLARLGAYQKFLTPIAEEEMFPAVGQGALGLQARAKDLEILRLLQKINHRLSRALVTAERAFLSELQGGCRVPAGICSKIVKGKLFLKARVFSVKTKAYLEASAQGSLSWPDRVGISLAQKLLRLGASNLLRQARS